MNHPSDPSICPKCGASLEESTAYHLCPKCLLANVGDATPLASPGNPSRSRSAAPPMEELAPHFPELEILELIGVGGMGSVYKARQRRLDRLVALKILSADLASDPAFEERFNREARVLARLNHPRIVTIFDYGIQGPFSYLLMEYVDGMNLRQAMRTGSFTPADALALVKDVCSALEYAHAEGILHRDIKPENILIDSRGRIKVADFGIAKLTGATGKDDYTLTYTGAAIGSPHYMAPELFESPGDVDQRADIYSLGVLFYELLTRELPIGRFAPPSARAPMDPRIDEIVMRALEKDRQARYQHAGEVKVGVSAIGKPTPPSPPQPANPPAPQPPASHPPVAMAATPLSYSAPQPQRVRWKAALTFYILSTLIGIPLMIAMIVRERDVEFWFSLLGFPIHVLAIIFLSILHYQCWAAIPERFRSLSPGKAVGFLFIPFFNFYWAFLSWPRLANDLKRWQTSTGNPYPSGPKGLAITHAILFVLNCTIAFIPHFGVFLSPLGLIIFIPLYKALVTAINRTNGYR